jgi:hypothetical protein
MIRKTIFAVATVAAVTAATGGHPQNNLCAA